MTNKEAITHLKSIRNMALGEVMKEALTKAIEAFEERPQGEWIFEKANNEHTDGYICSICGCSYHTKVPYFAEFKFCPNCGAEMGGKEE